MAAKKKSGRGIRKAGSKIWSGILFIWNYPILISIVLLVLAVVLINLLVTQTFKPYFNCAHLLGSINSLCSGVSIDIKIPLVYEHTFTILPALSAMNSPLEAFRQFITWDIIILFALFSLALAFVVSKIAGFIRFVMTPEGRKIVLTNVSVFLLFFVIFCALFYFKVVA